VNGCDPEKFSTESLAEGACKVGYAGKIGARLDIPLVCEVASSLPEVDFVFAGPILDGDFARSVAKIPNVRYVGDVHYKDLPRFYQSLDIGWVPHRVGVGEVGGDVLKTYEYRAAGLPVVSTPVAGAGSRGLGGVFVADRTQQSRMIQEMASNGPRIARIIEPIPSVDTWEFKCGVLSQLLSVSPQ